MNAFQKQELSQIIEINSKKCKGCDSCKASCPTNAIDGNYGTVHHINSEKCIFCGQCLVNCPFGAPTDLVDPVDQIIKKLKNKDLTVVAAIVPAVRAAIGEEFGMPPGSLPTEKLYGAMKQAGFKIFDINFAADHTIMEEGSELLAKIRHYILEEPTAHPLGPLPQFTSCCPAWVRYMELNYPQIIPHLSSAKSPMMMAGTLAKTYGAKKVWHVEPEKIYVVGITPCTAKKFECSRPEFDSTATYLEKESTSNDSPAVDNNLTTRDLARLFKKLNINVNLVYHYKDSDNPLAEYSSAGTIFTNTGGVMEAALRTVHFIITGTELEALTFTPVRSLQGIKEAHITMTDKKTGKLLTVKVAMVYGLKENVIPLIEQVIAGTSPYHFIEVMNCPSGCINGDGQPINTMGTSWLDKWKAILPWN